MTQHPTVRRVLSDTWSYFTSYQDVHSRESSRGCGDTEILQKVTQSGKPTYLVTWSLLRLSFHNLGEVCFGWQLIPQSFCSKAEMAWQWGGSKERCSLAARSREWRGRARDKNGPFQSPPPSPSVNRSYPIPACSTVKLVSGRIQWWVWRPHEVILFQKSSFWTRESLVGCLRSQP